MTKLSIITKRIPDPLRLSTHFLRSEFEKSGPMPNYVVGAYAQLCGELLEPIREKFGVPIIITSGYRSPNYNVSVGGDPNSAHVGTSYRCAADFRMSVDLQVVFDWIRLSSGLLFDKVILEREKEDGPPSCIHIAWRNKYCRRAALEGLTHGRGKYKPMEVEIAEATTHLTDELMG